MTISLFFLATEKTGGLFDLDGTLPLMAIQFLSLMFVLNFLLYTPLLTVIYERNQYINKNLASASNILEQTNNLIHIYENEVVITRKKAQQEIVDFKKAYQEFSEKKTQKAQSDLATISQERLKRLEEKTNKVFSHLENHLSYYKTQILKKLFSTSLPS